MFVIVVGVFGLMGEPVVGIVVLELTSLGILISLGGFLTNLFELVVSTAGLSPEGLVAMTTPVALVDASPT